LLLRLLAPLRPSATVVVAGAMAEAAVRVVDALVVASAVADVTAVAAVVVNTAAVISSAAMAAVNPAPTAADSRLLMVIAVDVPVVALANTAATALGTAMAGGPATTVMLVAGLLARVAIVLFRRASSTNTAARMVLAEPAMQTTPLTEARVRPAHGPTINVTSNTLVATVVQASNPAASAAVVAVAVAASVVAPVAVAPPAVADESPTPTIGALSPVGANRALAMSARKYLGTALPPTVAPPVGVKRATAGERREYLGAALAL
jgi:hypothetical protein